MLIETGSVCSHGPCTLIYTLLTQSRVEIMSVREMGDRVNRHSLHLVSSTPSLYIVNILL